MERPMWQGIEGGFQTKACEELRPQLKDMGGTKSCQG